jgi:rare lipoprotein A
LGLEIDVPPTKPTMGIQKIYYALTVLFIFFFSFSPNTFGQEVGDTQNGLASWYGSKYHGKRTSSGQVYNRHKLTAAHNGLPLGTTVKVTNTANGESVVVYINDRGPFRGARIIDLSEAAARKIDYHKEGLAKVTVEVLELPEEFLASRAKSQKPVLEPEVKEEVIASAATPVATPSSSKTDIASSEGPVMKPVVVPAVTPQPMYVVQAGAYSSVSNAEAQVEKLRRMYQKMPIALVEETVNGKKVHRILAGKFVSKTIAEQARKDLGKRGFNGLVRQVAEPTAVATL